MQSFPSIFIDDFMRTFSTTSIGVSIIAASYFYSYNLMQIPAGMLCDKFGTKRILILSSLACIVALTLFSHAHTLQSAIGCRMLMGLGASSAAVIMILICKEYFNVILLPVLIGIAQFACNIGALCGQYPLTYLSAAIGWRSAILSLSTIPFLLIIATLIFFRNKSNVTSKPTRQYWQETKEVFSNKRNWHIALYAMLLWTPFYTFASLWGIPFLREKLGVNITEASKLLAIAWIGSGVGSILIGILSSHLRKRRICIMLSAALGIILFPFLILCDIHNMALLSCILFLFGLSSAGQALSFVLIDDNNKSSLLGTASGFNNTIIMIGPMLIDPIVGSLLKLNWDGTLHEGIPFYSIANFQCAFTVIPILFVAAFVVSIFYRESNRLSDDVIVHQNVTLNDIVMPATSTLTTVR
jgi:MFS family permease